MTASDDPRRPRYVLLMRHGPRSRLGLRVSDVAGGLATYIRETAELPCHKMVLGPVLHAGTPQTIETFNALAAALTGTADLQPSSSPLLDPDRSGPANPYVGGSQNDVVEALLQAFRGAGPVGGQSPNAILVVGHSPQIDWLLQHLAPQRYRLSLAPAEIACIRVGKTNRMPGQLRWTLSPTDKDTTALLREKIKGKMESAKVLSALIAAALSFVLGGFKDIVKPPSSGGAARLEAMIAGFARAAPSSGITYAERLLPFCLAVVFLLLATALFLAAFLHYDRLLMPKRFWSGAAPAGDSPIAWRPPSSDLLVMYQNMQRIWFRTFMPAVWLTGASLLLLTYPATIEQIAAAAGDAWLARIAWVGVAVLTGAVLWRVLSVSRPLLGVQD
jgi:hypothetical protein